MGSLNSLLLQSIQILTLSSTSLKAASTLHMRKISTSEVSSSSSSSLKDSISELSITKPSMTISESKITGIQNVLDKYFPDPPVPLNSKDSFTFLCSVILSAQTTDGMH